LVKPKTTTVPFVLNDVCSMLLVNVCMPYCIPFRILIGFFQLSNKLPHLQFPFGKQQGAEKI
jgi:hypothetical protein